jgi:TRAP-type C4-dicarboxylate transport system substrate-binding protein
MDMTAMLGASPTPMAMGEVYGAIQTGVVDGAENNWSSYYTWSHHEVARYFTLSGHMAAPEMILVNVGIWNSFSAEDQAIIRRAAQHASRIQREAWIAGEAAAEAAARAAGTVVFELSPAEHQRFVDALGPMFEMPAWAPVAPLVNRIRAVP